jgi:sulfoxide reductase heme-binding subunit YedZ
MQRRTRQRLIQGLVSAVALLPLAGLVYAALADRLGANPIETVTHVTGEWALRFLLVALAITPLRLLTSWSQLAPFRRTFGLLAFSYASLHLLTFVTLDHFFDWGAIVEDVVERPYVSAGLAAFACMLPLAVTSTRGWTRRLGRRWVQLHRLAYVAGVAAVVHYLWLVKADRTPPLIHAAVLALLFAVRLGYRFARPRRATRESHDARAGELRSPVTRQDS